MNDNHKGGAKILSFGVVQDPKSFEPTGAYHTVDVWQCSCGHTLFNFSKQFGMQCDACNKTQVGFD